MAARRQTAPVKRERPKEDDELPSLTKRQESAAWASFSPSARIRVRGRVSSRRVRPEPLGSVVGNLGANPLATVVARATQHKVYDCSQAEAVQIPQRLPDIGRYDRSLGSRRQPSALV